MRYIGCPRGCCSASYLISRVSYKEDPLAADKVLATVDAASLQVLGLLSPLVAVIELVYLVVMGGLLKVTLVM